MFERLVVPVEAKNALNELLGKIYSLMQGEISATRQQFLLPFHVLSHSKQIMAWDAPAEVTKIIQEYLCLLEMRSRNFSSRQIKIGQPMPIIYENPRQPPFLPFLYNVFCTISRKLWPMIDGNISVIGTIMGLVPDVGTIFDGMSLGKKYQEDADLKALSKLLDGMSKSPSKPEILKALEEIKKVYLNKIKPDLLSLISDKKGNHFAWELVEQAIPLGEFFLNHFVEIFVDHERLLIVRPEYYDVLRESILVLKNILQFIDKALLGGHIRSNINFIIDTALSFGEKFGATPPTVKRYNTMLSMEAPSKTKLDQKFLCGGSENGLMDFLVDVSPLENPLFIKYRTPEIVKQLRDILEKFYWLTFLGEEQNAWAGVPFQIILGIRELLFSFEAKQYLQLKSSGDTFFYYLNNEGNTQLESAPSAIEFTEEFTPKINEIKFKRPHESDIFIEESDETIAQLAKSYSYWIVELSKAPDKQLLDDELKQPQCSKPKKNYSWDGDYFKLPRLIKCRNLLWVYECDYRGNTTLEALKKPICNIEFSETATQRRVHFSNNRPDYEKQCVVYNAKSEIVNKHKMTALPKLWCAHNDMFEVVDRAIDFPLALMKNKGYHLNLKRDKSPHVSQFLIKKATEEGSEGNIIYEVRNFENNTLNGVILKNDLENKLGSSRYKEFIVALEQEDVTVLQAFLCDLLDIVGPGVAPTVFKPYVVNSLTTIPAPINQDLRFWQDIDASILAVFTENRSVMQYLHHTPIENSSLNFLEKTDSNQQILDDLHSACNKYLKLIYEIDQRESDLDAVRKEMALEDKFKDAPKVSFFEPVVAFKSLALLTNEGPKPRNHVSKDTFKPLLEKIQIQSNDIDVRMEQKRAGFLELTNFLNLAIIMEKAYLAVLDKQKSVTQDLLQGNIHLCRQDSLNFALDLSRITKADFVWNEVEGQMSMFAQYFPVLKGWYAVRWQNDLKPLHASLIQQVFQHDVQKETSAIKTDREGYLKDFIEQLKKLELLTHDANEDELSQLEGNFNQIAAKKSLFDTKSCFQDFFEKITSLVNDPFYQSLAKEYSASSGLSELAASIQVLSVSFCDQLKSVENAIKNRRDALLLDSENAVQEIEKEIEAHKQQVEKDKRILNNIIGIDRLYQTLCQEKFAELEGYKKAILAGVSEKSQITCIALQRINIRINFSYTFSLANICFQITSETDPGFLQIQKELNVLEGLRVVQKSNKENLLLEKSIITHTLKIHGLMEKSDFLRVYGSLLDSVILDTGEVSRVLDCLYGDKINFETALGEVDYLATLKFLNRFKNETSYWKKDLITDLTVCKAKSTTEYIETLSLIADHENFLTVKKCDLEKFQQQYGKNPDAKQYSVDTHQNVLNGRLQDLGLMVFRTDMEIGKLDIICESLKKANEDLQDINQKIQTSFDACKELEESLENFSKERKDLLQEKYSILSSPITLTRDYTNVAAQNDKYLKDKDEQLSVLEYRLELCRMKKDLIDTEESLREFAKKANAFQIPDLMFRRGATINPLLFCRWEIHEGLCEARLESSEKSLAAYEVLFNTLNDRINALKEAQEKLESDEMCVKDKSSSVPLQKNANMIHRLFELKDQIVEACEGHKLLLDVENEYFIGESEDWKGFHQNLMSAQKLFEKVNASISYLEEIPTDLVQRVVNAECEAEAILKDDEYYRTLAKAIQDYKTEEARIKQLIIDKSKLSDLEIEFNEELNQLLVSIQDKLVELEKQYAVKKAAWDQLFVDHQVMRNSRELLASDDHKQRDYRYYDLRGIRLSDRDFSTAAVTGANFDHAVLTSCTFASRLDGVDFSDADASTCNFDHANFQGIIVNERTKIDSEYYRQILLNNFANPDYHDTPRYYEALLQRISPTADDVLAILKTIAVAPILNKSSEQQLIARKARAVMVIELMLPKLQSIEEVVKLKELIDTKHLGANNPFAYIRQERDWLKNILGMTHGNTGTWQKISSMIKNHLFTLSQESQAHSLQKKTYQDAKKIMKTHTTYDYGFGFFYTPVEASRWEQEKSRLVVRNSIN